MAKMYLMCGLSGVGKTTFAKKFAEENNLVYLGIDEEYARINGDECIHENTIRVWISFYEKIHSLEVRDIDCIIDTNAITHCHREQFLEWFPTFEHHLIFIDAPEKLRWENNKQRRRVVPDSAMAKMYRDSELPELYNEDGFKCDTEADGWRTIWYVANNNNHFEKPELWRPDYRNMEGDILK